MRSLRLPRSLWLVVGALLACGPPTITANDHATLSRLCEESAGTRKPGEEARVYSALESDKKGYIVGICAKERPNEGHEYKVATTTLRSQTEHREEICDAIRRVIPKRRVVVYCREDRQCRTRCGAPGKP